jgi:hypothetical protein
MGYGDISEKCVACSGLFAGKPRAYRNFVNREYYAELQERGSPAKGIAQTPQNHYRPRSRRNNLRTRATNSSMTNGLSK